VVSIKKHRAGSDSHGNLWKKDGSVVDVEPDVAAELLAIPDGGFEQVSDDEVPDSPVVPDSNAPGGTPVHHPAGNEPGAGAVLLIDPDQAEGELGGPPSEPGEPTVPNPDGDPGAGAGDEPPAAPKQARRRAAGA
jgi:hypothetical protein